MKKHLALSIYIRYNWINIRVVILLETISQRIIKIVNALGGNKSEFARRINLTPAYISKLDKKSDMIPSDRTITDICREFNVSEHWLRTGEGDMFIQLSEDADFIRVMTEIQVSDDELIKSILMAYWDLPNDKKAAIRDLVDGILKRYSKKENAGQ